MRSLVTVTSSGSPTVHVLFTEMSCAPPATSISFAVPCTVNVVVGLTIAGLFWMNASLVLSASFQFDCTLTSAFVAILFSLASNAEVKSSVDKPLPATLSSLVAIVVFRLAIEALLAFI